MAFVASKDAATSKGLMKSFKTATKILAFMSDKDLLERKVIKKNFPNVNLFLCVFHTLTAMNRKIYRLPISKEEKQIAMELLEKLVYSESADEYDALSEKF